ncbi:thermostable hemolysin [Pseudaeromonas paramecii]|uniref:Thermostable hemolysin n=1 Tax=Pseudaeromonas paramecii TaxID=2138166 RepID=A0ABP8PWH0_9GAMM
MEPALHFAPPTAQQLAQLHFSLHRPDAELTQFVAERFSAVHGARVGALMPWQAVLRRADGPLLASVGLRLAGHEPLFLEQYLDYPIEQQLAAQLQQPVDRAAILELGNLASRGGMARLLILIMVTYLNQQQFRYVTFTATQQVQGLFNQLGLLPITLAPAQAQRVEEPASWGRYYESNPRVLAGSIAQGWQRLQTSTFAPLLAGLPACGLDLAREASL